jgi:hypothetical protein
MSRHSPPTDPWGGAHRGEALRSTLSVALLLIVTAVIVAIIFAVGWWLFSVLVNPLPYSNPEAMAVPFR